MRCACPNDAMIWIAMASSAHHDPNRRLVRTQRIQCHARAKRTPRTQLRIVALLACGCQWRESWPRESLRPDAVRPTIRNRIVGAPRMTLTLAGLAQTELFSSVSEFYHAGRGAEMARPQTRPRHRSDKSNRRQL